MDQLNYPKSSANDDRFNIEPFLYLNEATRKSLPKHLLTWIEPYRDSLIKSDISLIKTYAEGVYKMLIQHFGTKEPIPPNVIEALYPIENTGLSDKVRLTLAIFLFNKHPTKQLYTKLKGVAEECVHNNQSIESINAAIQANIQNTLTLWKAQSWNGRTQPFPKRLRKVA